MLPQRGSLLGLTGLFSSGIIGSTYNFMKLTAGYEHFFPVPWGHIFSLQVRGGVMFGEAPFYDPADTQ